MFFFSFFIMYEFLKRKKITIWYHINNFIFLLLLIITKFFVNGPGSVKFRLFHPFIKNIYILLGSMGYYFKSMISPFDFVMFTFIDNIIDIKTILWGLSFILILTLLLYLSIKKENDLKIPLLFIFNFLPFYLLFAFSNLYPYSISTRYMIVPFIGILWIGVKYILKIRNNFKYYIKTLDSY